MPDPAAMEPLLLPVPKSIRLTGGSVDCRSVHRRLNVPSQPAAEAWALPDESDAARLPLAPTGPGFNILALTEVARVSGRPEGWHRLEITTRKGRPHFRLEHSTPAGAQLGVTTLQQILSQYATDVPAMLIEDQPAFAARGVMLDVSRDRVPTALELCQQPQWLSELKLNHLQLYTEHTFEYQGHDAVWSGWSPITAKEAALLDRIARSRDVELAANQNCFGHLASWLRHPNYAHLAETHGDWVFDVWPRKGPFSLCPTDPESLELIEDLLGQLLPCFKSPLVNIGCDETYDIAYGRSKEEVARRGRAAVYLDFVAKVAAIARKHGKRSMFWADIALSHPECVKDIPQDMIALAWGYEPEAPFAKWCELLRSAGREVWVCPGTSSWRSITGRTAERHGNIRAAAEQGSAGGASGMLICDWGDTGHHQQWPISLMGIAHGAAAAWNPAAPFDPRAASLHVFRDKSLTIGSWLEELGDVDQKLRQTCGALSAPGRVKLPNQSALFIDMLKKLDELTEVGRVEAWEDARDHIEQLATSRPTLPSEQMNDELKHTIAVARFAAARGAGRRHPGGLGVAAKKDLRDQLEAVIAEHRRLWLLRSREGGLEHSCGYYRQIMESLA